MKARTDWHKSFFRNSFYNPADKAALAKAPEEVVDEERAKREGYVERLAKVREALARLK